MKKPSQTHSSFHHHRHDTNVQVHIAQRLSQPALKISCSTMSLSPKQYNGLNHQLSSFYQKPTSDHNLCHLTPKKYSSSRRCRVHNLTTLVVFPNWSTFMRYHPRKVQINNRVLIAQKSSQNNAYLGSPSSPTQTVVVIIMVGKKPSISHNCHGIHRCHRPTGKRTNAFYFSYRNSIENSQLCNQLMIAYRADLTFLISMNFHVFL